MTSPVPARTGDGEADAACGPPRFSMRFTSTPRGAQLARRMVAKRLTAWGHTPESDVHQSMTLVAGELAANAVRHGHVPGRDFRLTLTATPTTLRVEVTDTRGELRPKPRSTPHDAENGRGLLLVARIADRWAVQAHPAHHPGKTVWAEIGVTCPVTPAAEREAAAWRQAQKPSP
jgi:anti-sigma regulatory factor (Ser/Thr protein kinase)